MNMVDVFEEEINLDVLGEVVEEQDLPAAEPVVEEDIFTEEVKSKEPDLLTEFLEENGIKDSKVKIVNEQNEEEEVDFNTLSKEDKLDILSSFKEVEVMETPENAFLQELEKNNLTVEEFLKQYAEEVAQSVKGTTEVNYDIDAYDNDELFILDLKTKYDLTDEELLAELEKEKANEELFTKKTEALRTQYKELEDEYKKAQQLEFEKEQQDKYQEFSNTMVDVAVNTPEFYGLELEDSEKNEVLSYLLDLDENGNSMFYNDLNDPNRLYEAAWFLKYGKSAFDAIKTAYQQEVKQTKTDKARKQPKKVIIKDNANKKITNIHDLTF
jgi:hypothetical protein